MKRFLTSPQFIWTLLTILIAVSGWFFNLYNNIENRVNALEGEDIGSLSQKLDTVIVKEAEDRNAILGLDEKIDNLTVEVRESKKETLGLLSQIINILRQ